jgi:hypothetical protein
MSTPVTIRKVENKQDFKAFFEFPWTIHKDNPNWVPPLKSIRRETLDKKKNPAWEYLEGDYYAAWRGDQIVGTIAAFVNYRHNEYHGEHVSWFGFFESINDPDVATALLNTAIEWGKSRAYDAIRGPQSFTTHEECGLLIDGFERPVMLMSYNPPYYQDLIENHTDFKKVMDTHSLHSSLIRPRCSRPSVDPSRRLFIKRPNEASRSGRVVRHRRFLTSSSKILA